MVASAEQRQWRWILMLMTDYNLMCFSCLLQRWKGGQTGATFRMHFPPIWLHTKPFVSSPPLWPFWPLCTAAAEALLWRASASKQLAREPQPSWKNTPWPHLCVCACLRVHVCVSVCVQKLKSLVFWVMVEAMNPGAYDGPARVISTGPPLSRDESLLEEDRDRDTL